jgi:hypothetical protein
MESHTADVGAVHKTPAADAAGQAAQARGDDKPRLAVSTDRVGEGAAQMTGDTAPRTPAPHGVEQQDGSQPGRPARWWSALREAVARESQAPDRNDLSENPDKLRYLRSWMLLRFLIGVLGLLLVLVTWLGSALLPDGQWALRGSLSAYYYSGMREFFTCTLAATGVFLIAYKAFERSLENVVTLVAGLAIVLVSFFPTTRPAETKATTGLTPLQSGLGETTVGLIHGCSALVFILLLSVISYLFARREGARAVPAPGARFTATYWKRLHWGCASGIVLACLFFLLHAVGVPFGSWTDPHALWLTEVVAVIAFATSWTCKGAELWKLSEEAARPAGAGRWSAALSHEAHGRGAFSIPRRR